MSKPILPVDFNRLRSDGLLSASRYPARLDLGQKVIVEDAEGNQADAEVMYVTYWVHPDMTTWRSATHKAG